MVGVIRIARARASVYSARLLFQLNTMAATFEQRMQRWTRKGKDLTKGTREYAKHQRAKPKPSTGRGASKIKRRTTKSWGNLILVKHTRGTAGPLAAESE